MFLARNMVRAGRKALERTQAIHRHMMSTSPKPSPFREDQPVVFEQHSRMRQYILKRGAKLNALNEEMFDLLAPQISVWKRSRQCHVIVGTSEYPKVKAFSAGGDVAEVVKYASSEETRSKAVDYFKKEFEFDYLLSTVGKPYVAVMDGFTMGGGVGLAAPATFRIATENTRFAMPETNIGYFPDVGGSYYLNQLDGFLGRYLSLTGLELKGRTVFELGFATHYIPSARISALLGQLADARNSEDVNTVLESLSAEREGHEPPTPLTGAVRLALDDAFSEDTVEGILERLSFFQTVEDQEVSQWAKNTLATLGQRSPTSLKVALRALQKARGQPLKAVFQMEIGIAATFCSGITPDFQHGVTEALVKKSKEPRSWSPPALQEVTDELVNQFFTPSDQVPQLSFADLAEEESPSLDDLDPTDPAPEVEPFEFNTFTLPTEAEIEEVVRGSHSSSGSSGLQIQEVIDKFNALTGDKVGVEHKVREVLERRCRIVDNGDGNTVWLEWRSDDEE